MKETDFYGIFSGEGQLKLEKTLIDLSEEFSKIKRPDFEGSEDEEGSADEDEDEDEDGGDWSADVDLE